MKKQIFSRFSYVHYNKNNITVGIKGEVKRVFQKKDLTASITQIQRQGEELSKLYTKNTKFPSFLGLSGETVLTREASEILQDLAATGKTQAEPKAAKDILTDLIQTAQNEQVFEQKYYSAVNQYYGTNFSTARTKQELIKGTFKAPRGDVAAARLRERRGRKKIYDYERYREWFENEDERFSSMRLDKVKTQAELNEYAQEYLQQLHIPAGIRDERYKDYTVTPEEMARRRAKYK